MTAKFFCARYPQYVLWRGSVSYEFKDGVLDVDDDGAAWIRTQPVYGRHIVEVAPAPPPPPLHPELHKALEDGFGICPECGQEFQSGTQMQRHYTRSHGQKEAH